MTYVSTGVPDMTIGLDLSDKLSQLCGLAADGGIVEESRVATTEAALRFRFTCSKARVVIEAGSHSLWVSRLLSGLGHEVVVANPRKLRLIFENDSKDDRVDARYLARVGRLDPALLAPVEVRDEISQEDLVLL